MVTMKEIVIGGIDPISCRWQINAVAKRLWELDALTENPFHNSDPIKRVQRYKYIEEKSS